MRGTRGQSLVEFSFVLPLILVIGLGLIEVGYELLDQHVVAKLSREGSNLISRNTSLEDAVSAMTAMSTRPVDFDTHSKVIFSVLKKGARAGTANYDKIYLYQRREFGPLSDGSRLVTRGAGSFGGPPDYKAINPDTTTALQVTSVPASLIGPRGGMIYVTEIYTSHELLTPVRRFGLDVPRSLYSIAYF
jgi:hypothetical protein